MSDVTDPRLDETVLSPTMVRLFGRLFRGLQLNQDDLRVTSTDRKKPRPSDNPLTDKLSPELDPRLARIYGFSYEGHYYKLPNPQIMLVHGDGEPVGAGADEKVDLGIAGVEYRAEFFSLHVRVWAYDKIDMSLRIELTSGTLEDVLLPLVIDESSDRSDLTGRADLVGRADLIARGRAGR